MYKEMWTGGDNGEGSLGYRAELLEGDGDDVDNNRRKAQGSVQVGGGKVLSALSRNQWLAPNQSPRIFATLLPVVADHGIRDAARDRDLYWSSKPREKFWWRELQYLLYDHGFHLVTLVPLTSPHKFFFRCSLAGPGVTQGVLGKMSHDFPQF